MGDGCVIYFHNRYYCIVLNITNSKRMERFVSY